MKKYLFGLLLVLVDISSFAQPRVVDTQGEPMIGAAVIDRNGTPINFVGLDGLLPAIDAASYPITLRCAGYEDMVVDKPTDCVVMTPHTYEMNELVVRPGQRPECRVICYIREIGGMNNRHDSVRITSEYMADFMLAPEKEKGVTTWTSPRVLAKDQTVHYSEGVKTQGDELRWLSFAPFFASMKIPDVEVAKELKGKTSGTASRKNEKTGLTEGVMTLSPAGLTVYADALARKKDHKLSIGIFKLMGLSVSVHELWMKRHYQPSATGHYNYESLAVSTISMKMRCAGKPFQQIFGDKEAVECTSYVEVFPVSIEYLTREEARALKKEKNPSYPMTIPAAAR